MKSLKADAALKQAKAGLHLIPEHMRNSVMRYITDGVQVGGFLTKLLDGELDAARHADPVNLAALDGWGKFLKEHAPANCWGAVNKRRAWQQLHGLAGWE